MGIFGKSTDKSKPHTADPTYGGSSRATAAKGSYLAGGATKRTTCGYCGAPYPSKCDTQSCRSK